MADLDLATLTAPIDDEQPCGPDLDAEDDANFANFVSASEMVLPDRYFVEDHEGNRKPFYTLDRFQDLDLGSYIKLANKLLQRTHDLRLLCLVAKIHIFDRKLNEFQIVIEAIAILLESYWDQMHPEADLRGGALERLNEQYTVVTALNNAPLFRSKKYVLITWQSYSAAVRGSAGGREDADPSAVERDLIKECQSDPTPIEAVQVTVGALSRDLRRINAVCAEKLPSGAPDLRRLQDAVGKIRAMLDRVNPPASAPGDASAEAQGSGAGGEVRPTGGLAMFGTTEEAGQALGVATRYLAQTEPSSPGLLLLRQAQALIGKSFLEVIDSLLPEQVRRATLSVAALPVFSLPLRQLADNGVSPRDDVLSDDHESREGGRPAAVPLPVVASRGEALALLDRVAAHYRTAEPSSPIPMLIERARDLAGKDFMSLIRAMLPESVLRGD